MNHSATASVPPSELCQQISCLLYNTLATTQERHLTLLTEKGKTLLLIKDDQVVISQIHRHLTPLTDLPALLTVVEKILGQLFQADFYLSTTFGEFRSQLKALIHPAAPSPTRQRSNLSPLATVTPIDYSQNSNGAWGRQPLSFQTAPTGLLLIDAENMPLPLELEVHLETIGDYPIQHRVAVGNWKGLGDRDQDLYNRGYHMVHVPPGKNGADIKMALEAEAISYQIPTIREVFICSNDSDHRHIANTLIGRGLKVYQVSFRGDNFTICNIRTQTKTYFQLPTASVEATPAEVTNILSGASSPDVQIPTLRQLELWLRSLMRQEQNNHPGQPITLQLLGQLFRDRNQVSIRQVLAAHASTHTLTTFLEAHEWFDLQPCPNTNGWQVILKESTQPPALPPQAASSSASPGLSSGAETVAPVTDATTLEQGIVLLLQGGAIAKTDGYVNISHVGVAFHRAYGESLSQALKRVGEPKGLPKFFQKCKSLETRKLQKQWQVKLKDL